MRSSTKMNIFIVCQAIESRSEIKNLAYGCRTKSGQHIDTLISGLTISFNDQPCWLAILKDISDRTRFEREMARLERLNLIGEMAAGIGHEIRNPMTTVRGFLQLLHDRGESERLNDYYDLIMEELDRANAIITEYLSLAKDKRVLLRDLSLNTLINDIFPMIQADSFVADKNIELELG